MAHHRPTVCGLIGTSKGCNYCQRCDCAPTEYRDGYDAIPGRKRLSEAQYGQLYVNSASAHRGNFRPSAYDLALDDQWIDEWYEKHGLKRDKFKNA